MNVSVRETGAWQRTLDIEVPERDVEQRLEQVARRIQRRAVLPGFRRGHVPLEMVRQNFADVVEREFLDEIVPDVTREALHESGLQPAVPPLVRNLQFNPGQAMRLEAVVEVRPEVEARNYRGLSLTRRSRAIGEADVDKVVADLREESAVFVDLDRPAQRGDVVLLDSTRLDANGRRLPSTRAKGVRILLGAPDLLPDLENGLLGSEAGNERTFDVRYPADYRVAELAGRTARYVVRIRKIQEKKLRELDDNLARDVFRLDTVEALRTRVRENLEAEERARVSRELEAAVSEELIQRNPFDLPERLVSWMLDRVIQEATGGRAVGEALRRELEERYRPGVERSLRREVLLDAVARQEKLSVTPEETAAEIDRMANADPRQAARIRARYQPPERRDALRESLLERKALEKVIELADVRDEAVGETPVIVPATR